MSIANAATCVPQRALLLRAWRSHRISIPAASNAQAKLRVDSILSPDFTLERFSNERAPIQFVQGGFYFHPADQDQSAGPRWGKSHSTAVVSVYGNWRTVVVAFTGEKREEVQSLLESIDGGLWIARDATSLGRESGSISGAQFFQSESNCGSLV